MTMSRKPRIKSTALQEFHDRYVAHDPKLVAMYEKGLVDAEVGQRIYDLRTDAGLTQAGLARLVGTTPSVISRLEDADYRGHSVAMLRRIAEALDSRVEIRFVPVGRTAAAAKKVAKRAAPRAGGGRAKTAATVKSATKRPAAKRG